MRKHPLVTMAVLAVIAAALGVALGLAIDWFPVQASEQAREIDTLWDVLIIVSVPIFVLVEAVVLYCVWQFRMKPGQEDQDGAPIHGNTRLEIVWTAIPAIILVALCAYAFSVLSSIEEKTPDAMRVTVTGEQFAWTFQYPQGGGAKPVASTQLYLPKDKPVYFDVKAKDVLHSFWVPAFRIKNDAVPGITTHVRITPDRLGRYEVVCAELCGIGHAAMRQSVHVVTPAAFEKWIAGKKAPAGSPDGSPPVGGGAPAGGTAATTAQGKAVFTSAETGCTACHTLADAGASATIGPDLAKSLRGKDADYIRTAIVAPDEDIAEGFDPGIMPKMFGDTLSKPELDALVGYLDKVSK